MNALTITNTEIRTDAAGRFCLNDLHRAAGGEKRHGPAYWLETQQAQELAKEINDSTVTGFPVTDKNQQLTEAIAVYQGGNGPQGTYVCRELVYAYAMWISPAFHLRVIRAFDAMHTAQRLVPPLPATAQDTVSAILMLGEYVKKVPGVRPSIATAATLACVRENTGLEIEPLRRSLPALDESVCSHNPTGIGKLMECSAKKANQRLADSGLQFRNERDEWELTDAGKDWGEAVPYSRNGHAGYQILWNPDVVEVVRDATPQ